MNEEIEQVKEDGGCRFVCVFSLFFGKNDEYLLGGRDERQGENQKRWRVGG